MKKFTFFMSLFLMLGSLAAMAQTRTIKKLAATPSLDNAVTDLSSLTDGGTYVFYNVGKNKYVKTDITSLKLLNDASLTVDDDTDGLAVFTFHKVADAENTYKFETAISGAYIKGLIQSGDCYAEANNANTTAESFEIKKVNANNNNSNDDLETGTPITDASIVWIKGSNGKWFDMGDSQFVGWLGTGVNARYKIVPVQVSENDPVVYRNVTCNVLGTDGNAINGYTTTSYMKDGSTVTFNAPNASYYYTLTSQFGDNTTVGEGNTTFSYQVTKSTAPVKFDGSWYGVQVGVHNTKTTILIAKNEPATAGGTGNNVWHVRTEEEMNFNETTLPDYTEFSNALWKIEEDGLGVKIGNKQTGLYLNANNGGIVTLTAKNNATRFFIKEGSTNKYSLWTGTGNQYMGSHSTYNEVNNSRLGFWSWGSAQEWGSNFTFVEADLDAAIIGVGKTAATATLDATEANEADAQYVTSKTAADIANIKAALPEATNIAGLDAALSRTEMPGADVDANGYYRIINVNRLSNSKMTKAYLTTEKMDVATNGSLWTAWAANTDMDRKIWRVEDTSAFLPMLWKLEANSDGTFKIRNANTGCNMSSAPANTEVDMPVNPDNGGSYTFMAMPGTTINDGVTNDGKTMFLMIVNGQKLNAYGGKGGNYVKSYNSTTDGGNYWQLEKVTEVPAPISEAGYASVGYPFAVQVPAESGVKAYYASAAEDGVMTLEEYADGIIPAQSGAILVCEGGKSDLRLAITTTTATYPDNKLVAATARRIGFEADANYLMGVDSDSEVKFLRAEITSVPANKAYLPAANITAPTYAVAFKLGGESTGIGAVENGTAEQEQYFDLNGRRVLYPANGVFVTRSGKKVFIK